MLSGVRFVGSLYRIGSEFCAVATPVDVERGFARTGKNDFSCAVFGRGECGHDVGRCADYVYFSGLPCILAVQLRECRVGHFAIDFSEVCLEELGGSVFAGHVDSFDERRAVCGLLPYESRAFPVDDAVLV